MPFNSFSQSFPSPWFAHRAFSAASYSSSLVVPSHSPPTPTCFPTVSTSFPFELYYIFFRQIQVHDVFENRIVAQPQPEINFLSCELHDPRLALLHFDKKPIFSYYDLPFYRTLHSLCYKSAPDQQISLIVAKIQREQTDRNQTTSFCQP